MPVTRKEKDEWCILMGDTQERLDLIHAEADAMRARLEAEERGPSTVWEPASSDDEEFEDHRPMSPPMSPLWTSSGKSLTYPKLLWRQGLNFTIGTKANENGLANMEVHQHKLNDMPLRSTRAAVPFISPKSQIRRVSNRIQRRARVPISER